MSDPLWIFAYGSLIFRPGFPFVERRIAVLHNHARRFWQGSIDHRGVPGAPGRVVTLVEQAGARCWGIAFRVATECADSVLLELDRREQGGYERRSVTLELPSNPGAEATAGTAVTALVYMALPNNPHYLGEVELAALARQVHAACGPSGANRDYVLALAAALRELGLHDEHVFELEAELSTEGFARNARAGIR